MHFITLKIHRRLLYKNKIKLKQVNISSMKWTGLSFLAYEKKSYRKEYRNPKKNIENQQNKS